MGEGWGEAYACRLCIELAGERLIIILHRNSVTPFCVVGDVNVKAYDGACVNCLFVDGVARLVSNAPCPFRP